MSREPGSRSFVDQLGRYGHEHPGRLLIGVVVLAILVAGGALYWHHLQSFESTDDAEVGGHIVALGSRVSGTVVAVYVENNQSVVQGQMLVDLDPRDFQVAVRQAEAGLAQAEAQLAAEHPMIAITETTNATSIASARAAVADAEAAVAASGRDLAAAVAGTRQAEAASAHAQTEAARYRELVGKQEVSDEEYDTRRTTAETDAALVESRRATAEAARRGVEEQRARLAQARTRLAEAIRNNSPQMVARRASVANRQASVEMAQARLEQARLELSYCKIAAPVRGIVGDRTVEVGQRVQAGQQLMAITESGHVWVTANFKETQIARMRPGQPARIHVDALEHDFDGYVENLPGATGAQYSVLPPENATGNYVKVVQRLPVRIRFKPHQPGLERLRPGMSVEPTVRVQ